MIILTPPVAPAGNWNLPDEFVNPSAYTMTADQAHEILAQRGFLGYGASAAQYAWSRRGRLRRFASLGATWDEYANRLRMGQE